MDYTILAATERVLKLRGYIKDKIEIPAELLENYDLDTTWRGDLQLDFWSNKYFPTKSKYKLSLCFIMDDNLGTYCGKNISYSVLTCKNLPKIIGVKTPIDKEKSLAKINKYIQVNKQFLIDCIEE